MAVNFTRRPVTFTVTSLNVEFEGTASVLTAAQRTEVRAALDELKSSPDYNEHTEYLNHTAAAALQSLTCDAEDVTVEGVAFADSDNPAAWVAPLPRDLVFAIVRAAAGMDRTPGKSETTPEA